MATACSTPHPPQGAAWATRLNRLPPAAWLALLFAALSPTWAWMARRLQDGSDDPFGLLALAALGLLAWQQRHALRTTPRPGWLWLALLGTGTATLARGGAGLPALPALVVGLLSVLALAAGLLAFLARTFAARGCEQVTAPGVAAAPVLGLAVLALPLISSLQFYAGYPLRVLTAEVSRWLLAPAFTVAREGSSLLVEGRLVVVDAPCSGIQMAWLGYFTACVAALWAGRSDRAFLTRLPLVGALVLAGNIVRNSLLVACEGAGHAPPEWLHQGLGLLLLALVCVGIARGMGRPEVQATARRAPRRRSLRQAQGHSGLVTREGGRRVELA